MKKYKHISVWLMAVVILVCLDQWTKWMAQTFLRNGSIDVLPGIFRLYYLQNRGAAFGMLQGRSWLFMIFAAGITLLCGYTYLRIPRTNRMRLLRICMILLGAGAVGNMLDRLWHGYVIDFLYFSLIDFPVFNVADIYVTVGCGLLFLSLLIYKEDELSLFGRK